MDVEWRPFELHPEVPPEGERVPEHVRARSSGSREWMKRQAEESGREMVFSDMRRSSRRALEASEYARERGKHQRFHDVIFRRFFGEGQDLSDWDVLRASAQEVGLDPDDMQREVESGKYGAPLDEKLDHARGLGITGVPTFIFDDQYAIVGAQPYEIFQKVMDRIGKSPKDAQ